MSSSSTAPAPENEAELEAFRRRWREEVQSRNKQPEDQSSRNKLPEQPTSPERSKQQQHRRKSVVQSKPGPSTFKKPQHVEDDDVAPKAYHDLPNKEDALRLGSNDAQNQERARATQEPNSALEHYEKAVEKETHGQLGDSLKHYRKAFKLDDGVHEHYKNKHFPPSMFAKNKQHHHPNSNPSNAPPTLPNPAHHSQQAKQPHITSAPPPPQTQPQPQSTQKPTPPLPSTLKQLIQDFSHLDITPAPPPTELSPQQPCPLAEIPEEILSHILLELAIIDVASFARMAQVCKRMAYLVLTEDSIWKRVTLGNEVGFAAMHYDFVTDIEGNPLPPANSDPEEDQYLSDSETAPTPSPIISHSLLSPTYPTYHTMFRLRPRLRFNGCYISTVNYVRAGAPSSNTLTWSAPVHVVTYFRYLRFFRDGTVLSLLTTAEPADVVHHLTKQNLLHPPPPTLPGAAMKDALRGRWRLSGPASSSSTSSEDDPEAEPEAEGDIHIETQGVVPRYIYKLQLGLTHAGKSARNNKLVWKGFWSYNRLTDDWGEFLLRNDRAFWWSRVRSWDGWE